uniref:Iron-sulfur cluster transfer protein NUBPL n=1 Tax=Phallusia mammillata TaxID=59560 RepID=A0A6F9DM15_9ASCI|nr:iron-sulfur protein NUBPL-like [Phallusia mammillata]
MLFMRSFKKITEQVVKRNLIAFCAKKLSSQNGKDQQNVMGRGLPKKKPIPGVKDIILVASGKGGVGKSTISVNIALGMTQNGVKVGLLDADIFGPSIPKLMQINQKPEVNKDGLMIPPFNHGMPCMSMGFLIPENAPVVWRGMMVMQAVQQLLWKVYWENIDVLIVDMPPGTGDVPLSIIQNVPISGAVIVSTPQDIALTDVRRGVEMFKKMSVPVLGLVQNMSVYLCSNCGQKTHIFGKDKLEKLTKIMDLEILGDVPLHENISEFSDKGTPFVIESPESLEALSIRAIAQKVCEKLSNR